MWNRYLLIFLMPLACIERNPDYVLLSFPEDSCVDALAAYELCDWNAACRRGLRHDYPESWEPAKVTFEQCYIDSPRCTALEEGCEEL